MQTRCILGVVTILLGSAVIAAYCNDSQAFRLESDDQVIAQLADCKYTDAFSLNWGLQTDVPGWCRQLLPQVIDDYTHNLVEVSLRATRPGPPFDYRDLGCFLNCGILNLSVATFALATY